MTTPELRKFVSLGMFIIDDFVFMDEDGNPTGKTLAPQIGGGGTYAAIGARIWLPAHLVGVVIDRGYDFPIPIEDNLLRYGRNMWMFREQPHCRTTRALNSYRGDHRDFEYKTPRIRITPRDLNGTKLARSEVLHFICSPTRAAKIMSEVEEVNGWYPTTIYEPIPDKCIPEELPALKQVLDSISILSPNAEEALSLLSMPLPPTRSSVEQAAHKFLEFGIDIAGRGAIVIRCGSLGAYVKTRGKGGLWVDPYWLDSGEGTRRVVDVTGAGNSFLGGLGAGLVYTSGDVYKAVFYASISASFVVEQEGLPKMLEQAEEPNVVSWNGDIPDKRLEELRGRHR